MESFLSFVEHWKHPRHVVDFQERFGVKVVRVVRGSDADRDSEIAFKASDVDEWRRNKEYKKTDDNIKSTPAADPVLSSSGYSSESESLNGKTNTVFYRINSLFWYYVFLVSVEKSCKVTCLCLSHDMTPPSLFPQDRYSTRRRDLLLHLLLLLVLEYRRCCGKEAGPTLEPHHVHWPGHEGHCQVAETTDAAGCALGDQMGTRVRVRPRGF